MTKLQKIEQQLQNLQAEIEKLKQAEQNGNQWVPEGGDKYFFIEVDGTVYVDTWWGNSIDVNKLSIGNVFKTKEEVKFEVERLKVIAELKKYSSEFVHGGDNCQITFDYEDGKVLYLSNGEIKSSTLYFPSEATARQAVQEVGEDRVKKYYLGVE